MVNIDLMLLGQICLQSNNKACVPATSTVRERNITVLRFRQLGDLRNRSLNDCSTAASVLHVVCINVYEHRTMMRMMMLGSNGRAICGGYNLWGDAPPPPKV